MWPACPRSLVWTERTHNEQRAHSDQFEASDERSPARQRSSADCSRNWRAGARHHPLYAASARLERRRPGKPNAISVFDGRHECAGTVDVVAATSRQAAHFAPTARCGQRPANRRTAGGSGGRSRHGVAPWGHSDCGGQYPVRRLRAAAGFDHIYAIEPVPRDHGRRLRNFRQDPNSLNSLYVKSSTGTQVPLSHSAEIKQTNASLSINHQGSSPW